MNSRKVFTLIELLIIIIWIVVLSLIVLPVIFSASGNTSGKIISAELPLDFKETISIQRYSFECHLSYVALDGAIKSKRYWFWGFWASDINWINQEVPIKD